MPISPKLSRKLDETLGDEAAGEMTQWMQRVEAQRIAAVAGVLR